MSHDLTSRDELQRHMHMSYKYSCNGYTASMLTFLLGCITASSDVLTYLTAAVICLPQSADDPL